MTVPSSFPWIAALFGASAALAQQPAPAPAQPCAAPEYRQFDFWVGDWDVHDPSGKRVGENRITRIHNGCALLEEWRGDGDVTGSSLNLYDKQRSKWHQTWVDSGGNAVDARRRIRRWRDDACGAGDRSRAARQALAAADPLDPSTRWPRPPALGIVAR